MCVTCHSTPRKNEAGKTTAHSGVSCESCHGASGGDPGWLNRHAVYGLEGTRRNQETQTHRKARLDYCRKQGKIGPDAVYSLAKKCLQCHLVGNEKLVVAGHKLGRNSFEFSSFAGGEVRHNFHIDQTKNADASTLWMNPVGGKTRKAAYRRRQMFILGMFADLEVSLRLRAKATNAAYAGQIGGRIGAYSGKFGPLNAVAGTPETKAVGNMLLPLLGRLFAIQPGDKKFFNAQADKIAKAAKDFLKNDSLSKLDEQKLKLLDMQIPPPYYSSTFPKKKKD